MRRWFWFAALIAGVAAPVAGAAATRAGGWGERVTRLASSPEFNGLLLTIALLGLLIEMQTLYGIGGIIGAGALALFFGTHVTAGFASPVVIALALAALGAIALELHVVPGSGIFGVLGAAGLVAAVILAFGPALVVVALQALAIAIVLSAAGLVLFARVRPENALVARYAFAGRQGAEYVASSDHRALVGRAGFAASYLRPAGYAAIDGERIDVLTEGEFVTAGTPIVVTRVEGARIFVRPAS